MCMLKCAHFTKKGTDEISMCLQFLKRYTKQLFMVVASKTGKLPIISYSSIYQTLCDTFSPYTVNCFCQY